MSNKLKDESGFKLHRPTDILDPGFTLPGKKMHFISAKKAESTPGRPWEIIRGSDLPKLLLEQIKKTNGRAFTEKDDCYRVGDLVLAFATEEAVMPFTRARQEANQDQMQSVRAVPDDKGKNFQVGAVDESEEITPEFFRE